MGNLGLIPGLGRSPGGGHDNLLQYSCLENPRGQRSLAGYSSWGHKESDMTERLSPACVYKSRAVCVFMNKVEAKGWGWDELKRIKREQLKNLPVFTD